MATRTLKHPLHPSYWLVYLAFACGWLIAQLPIKSQLRLGRIMGRIAMRVAPRTRKITLVNIEKCFPHLSEQERKKFLIANFESTGMGIMETIMSWWTPLKRFKNRMIIENLHYYDQAQANGRGALYITPHFSSLEICGRVSAARVPYAVLYNKLKFPLLEKMNRKHLDQNFVRAIPREKIRDMIRTLKENTGIFYTPDIDPAQHGGVFAPFFGVNAYSLTATAKLAEKTGAPVIPIYFRRVSQHGYYKITILPPLENFPSGNDVEDAKRVNQVMQDIISRNPEQYFWQYKRFKSRPEGEADFYEFV